MKSKSNAFALFLSQTKSKILILCHAGADVDSFSAAACLKLALGKKFSVTIGVPDHINLSAKSLSQSMKIPFIINPKNFSQFDGIILTDLNSAEMLGSLKQEILSFKKPILVIDHHSNSNELLASSKEFSLIDDSRVSTNEIVYEILKENNYSFSNEMLLLIASGIITDSAHFLVGNAETFSIMAEVLRKTKKSIPEIVSLFSVQRDFGERIAKLKSAQRVKIFKINEFIVVTTDIGSFEATAASALVKLGADIAFAGDEEKGMIRISGRANNHFIEKNKFNLAKDVFEKLSQELGGSGGGHAAASAYNGSGTDLPLFLRKCVDLTAEFFSKKGKAQVKEYN